MFIQWTWILWACGFVLGLLCVLRVHRLRRNLIHDHQGLLPHGLHVITLLQLAESPEATLRVIQAVQRKLGHLGGKLVFAGHTEFTAYKSTHLSWASEGRTPTGATSSCAWDLCLVTEHRNAAEYQVLVQALGWTAGDDHPDDVKKQSDDVRKYASVGMLVPKPFYLIAPIVFDLLGLCIVCWDLIRGKGIRSNFKATADTAALMSQDWAKEWLGTIRWSESQVANPLTANQPMVMLNLQKAHGSEAQVTSNRLYELTMLKMFASSLWLRPIVMHYGFAVGLPSGEKPWFDRVALMYYPSKHWFHDMLHSTFIQLVPEKSLGDTECVVCVPCVLPQEECATVGRGRDGDRKDR